MSRRSRSRKLTEEERALWARVARAATPLAPRPPGAETDPAPAPGPGVAALRSSAAAPVEPPPEAAVTGELKGVHRPTPRRAEPPTAFHPAPETVSGLGPGAPGLDRRTAERLRKGRTPPEARIDLHGMSAERAHAALIRFIETASRDGLRCVLVITGKGAAAREGRSGDAGPMSGGRGVLRRDVPRWLRGAPLAPLVVGVYQAHPRHGGDGALYVYLKRRR